MTRLRVLCRNTRNNRRTCPTGLDLINSCPFHFLTNYKHTKDQVQICATIVDMFLSSIPEISSNSSFFIHSSPYSFKIILIFNFFGHNTNVSRVKRAFYYLSDLQFYLKNIIIVGKIWILMYVVKFITLAFAVTGIISGTNPNATQQTRPSSVKYKLSIQMLLRSHLIDRSNRIVGWRTLA